MMRLPVLSIVWLAALAAGACGAVTSPSDVSAGAGIWGGQGLALTMLAGGGARLDYGCDSGTIDERVPAGPFVARGTHTFGQGGPSQQTDPPRVAHAAIYEGTIDGETMQLTVRLPDLNRTIGDFSLVLNRPAVLERCG